MVVAMILRFVATTTSSQFGYNVCVPPGT